MADKERRSHVLAIPYPAQGHINPLLQLCIQLVPRGFTFTFVNTHHNHQRMLSSACIINGDAYIADPSCNIRMVSVAGGCPPELHGNNSKRVVAFQAAEEMQWPVEELLAQLQQGHDNYGISVVLSDVLLGWSQKSASKFGVAFWPASAATCSALLYFSDLAYQGLGLPLPLEAKGSHGHEAGRLDVLCDIPGLPPTHLRELLRVWNAAGKFTESAIRLILSHFRTLLQASCLLLNSFHELEGAALEALSRRIPTHAVGPLLPSQYLHFDHTRRDTDHVELLPLRRPSLFPEDGACLAWLDKQAPNCVIFISFGSISLRSDNQTLELAMGLEASRCPFLWVCRPYKPSIATNIFSSDMAAFIERTHGRQGFVVPWAPQLEVLSHPAVGGFMTHCGWNSTMESVAMGVPMLCWADSGERMSNQRFVVDFWKCGMEMVSRLAERTSVDHDVEEIAVVGKDHVERLVRAFMREEAGATLRARAAQLKITAMAASHDSSKLLDEFSRSHVINKAFARL